MNVMARLATCGYIERDQNVVFQGFAGSGKSYLGCALAKRTRHRRLQTDSSHLFTMSLITT
ncbi:ATP-binding protein [Brevibacterium antiquum]|uniref:ATP-binding protein n=1 Tax=Brevibacterium antiquum TaxID=234835 RepID=UPI001E44A487|nr:ATP-binding protein [Brevibacterium antiquum]